jgi:P27 family predicted phage terminase small subunit
MGTAARNAAPSPPPGAQQGDAGTPAEAERDPAPRGQSRQARLQPCGAGAARRPAELPPHLSDVAAEEWDRLAGTLHEMGVLTIVDRAALAAYCQAYGRWVEAEQKLRETPTLFKTPSGYVQQSPWLGIANKQLELMSRYMTELGMTPASRSRVAAAGTQPDTMPERIQIEFLPTTERDADRFCAKLEAMRRNQESCS